MKALFKTISALGFAIILGCAGGTDTNTLSIIEALTGIMAGFGMFIMGLLAVKYYAHIKLALIALKRAQTKRIRCKQKKQLQAAVSRKEEITSKILTAYR